MVVGKFQNIKANTMVSTLFIYYLQFQILYCISVAFMHLIVSYIIHDQNVFVLILMLVFFVYTVSIAFINHYLSSLFFVSRIYCGTMIPKHQS